jgi:CRISPR-associated protein Cmr5
LKQILAQERAAHALAKVNHLRKLADEDKSKKDFNARYTSYAESLPATILSCGLGQAAAMLLAAAKGEKNEPHYVLYQHLEDWLCREDRNAPYPGYQDQGLLEAITAHDRNHYLRAQAEALAWLEWLKKIAVAYLKLPEQTPESKV